MAELLSTAGATGGTAIPQFPPVRLPDLSRRLFTMSVWPLGMGTENLDILFDIELSG